MNSATIKTLLRNRSAPMDGAMILPAISYGLNALNSAYTLTNYYSPPLAAHVPLREEAGYWYKPLLAITPILLAFGWVDFFKAVSRYLQAADKDWTLVLDIIFRLIVASGATLATLFMLTSLAYIGPYILAALLGMNSIIGLYSICHCLKLAYQEPGHRWRHLKMAGEAFLGIAINTLAMALNFMIFQSATLILGRIKEFASSLFDILSHLEDLMVFLNGPVNKDIANIKIVGLAWLASVGVKLLISAWRINRQTWKMLLSQPHEKSGMPYDMEAWHDVKKIFSALGNSDIDSGTKVVLSLTLPFYLATITLYAILFRPVAALALGLPQLLLNGFCYLGTSKDSGKKGGGAPVEKREATPLGLEEGITTPLPPAKRDFVMSSSATSGRTESSDSHFTECSSRLHQRKPPPQGEETLGLTERLPPPSMLGSNLNTRG